MDDGGRCRNEGMMEWNDDGIKCEKLMQNIFQIFSFYLQVKFTIYNVYNTNTLAKLKLIKTK